MIGISALSYQIYNSFQLTVLPCKISNIFIWRLESRLSRKSLEFCSQKSLGMKTAIFEHLDSIKELC